MRRCADATYLDERTLQCDAGGSPFEATLAGCPPGSYPHDRTTVAVPTAQWMTRQVHGGSSKGTTWRTHVQHNPLSPIAYSSPRQPTLRHVSK